jgi:hypothetical protein
VAVNGEGHRKIGSNRDWVSINYSECKMDWLSVKYWRQGKFKNFQYLYENEDRERNWLKQVQKKCRKIRILNHVLKYKALERRDVGHTTRCADQLHLYDLVISSKLNCLYFIVMKCLKNKDSSLKDSHLNYMSAHDFCVANSSIICSCFKYQKTFIIPLLTWK